MNLAESSEGQSYGYYLNCTVAISSNDQLFICHGESPGKVKIGPLYPGVEHRPWPICSVLGTTVPSEN